MISAFNKDTLFPVSTNPPGGTLSSTHTFLFPCYYKELLFSPGRFYFASNPMPTPSTHSKEKPELLTFLTARCPHQFLPQSKTQKPSLSSLSRSTPIFSINHLFHFKDKLCNHVTRTCFLTSYVFPTGSSPLSFSTLDGGYFHKNHEWPFGH